MCILLRMMYNHRLTEFYENKKRKIVYNRKESLKKVKRQARLSNYYDTVAVSVKYGREKKKKKKSTQTVLNTYYEYPKWVYELNAGDPIKFREFKEIEIRPIVPNQKRGNIRVLKLYHRFAKVDVELKKWPIIEGYERYNVCKGSKYQDLSPMKLGPVYVDGKLFAKNIEDGWQCSKVWPFHIEQGPYWLKYWEKWSELGRMSNQARRHRNPNRGKTRHINKNVPLYSLFKGEKLGYKEARKKMYIPWYEELVVKTDAYKDLLNRHLSGIDLVLLEFDGLDRNNPRQNVDLTEDKLKELIEDDSRPFGHGLVLAAMLLGYPVWREYKEREIIQ